jgi:hypothetical protein
MNILFNIKPIGMFLVPLTKKQKTLVRAVAKLQLDCLLNILNNDNNGEEDTGVYCALNDLDYEEFNETVKGNIRQFQKVLKHPKYVGTLDKDNVAIVKTLMFKYYDRPTLRKARHNIWRKLDRANMGYFQLN